MCFAWVSEQTAIIPLYSINFLKPTGYVIRQQFNIQQL